MTKNSFILTHIFLCYQKLKNKENYFYTRFYIETNGAYSIKSFSLVYKKNEG